ncbi:codanin-1-like [Lethenteron reissneri]|uniref:codanin-1-like n=1 Tax=Lethenteron reissneri TaxID=7753 RepID=UPI002AB6E89C|nr:codanin-1-like [Lethenteron reissneri]
MAAASSSAPPPPPLLLLKSALRGDAAARAMLALWLATPPPSPPLPHRGHPDDDDASGQECGHGSSSALPALEALGEAAWREFIPFLLNFLREQASGAVGWSQPSPRKTPSAPAHWPGQRTPSDSGSLGPRGSREAAQSRAPCRAAPASTAGSLAPPSSLEHPQRGARQSLNGAFELLAENSPFGGGRPATPARGFEDDVARWPGSPPLERGGRGGDVAASGTRADGPPLSAGPADSAGERAPRSAQKASLSDFIVHGSDRHAARRVKQSSPACGKARENGSAAGALGRCFQSSPCQRADASLSGDGERGPRMSRHSDQAQQQQHPPHGRKNSKHRQGGTSLEPSSRRAVGGGQSSGGGEVDCASAVRSPDASGCVADGDVMVPPNLCSLEEFPSMGGAASSGNSRPSRRIKPTPVSVAHHRLQPNECFTSTPLSQPPPPRWGAVPATPRDRHTMPWCSPTSQSQLAGRHAQPGSSAQSHHPHSAMPRQNRAKQVSPDSTTSESANDSSACCTTPVFHAAQRGGLQEATPDATSPATPPVTSPAIATQLLLDSPAGPASQTVADESPGTPRPDRVSHRHQLDVFSELYSVCLRRNLVPNVLLEVYFTLQLLTVPCGTADVAKEEAPVVVVDNDRPEPSGGSDEPLKAAYFHSVHNCVYFAVKVLEKLMGLLGCLDRSTLRSLLEHERVATFSPSLLEQLRAAYGVSTARVITTPTSTILSVPFQPKTDNRANFPSNRSFQNFKKQRDVFYALIREWEDGRDSPGWEFERVLGNKIRAMMVQLSSEHNHSHFARLFQAQLIRMCKDPYERVPSRNVASPLLSALGGNDPSKLQRLQQRFTAPQAQGGPCPPPAFPAYQAFFRDFILVADSFALCQHLMDGLRHQIMELNGECILAPDGDWDTCEQEWREHFKSVLLTARLLAKFLGLIAFLPYRTHETTPTNPQEPALDLRLQSAQVLDVDSALGEARGARRLVLTLPWIIEFLGMTDRGAARMKCYARVFRSMLHIYRSLVLEPSEACGLNRMLLLLLLGWLFQVPSFPEEVFFAELPQRVLEDPSGGGLDTLPLVDQQLLFTCCPYIGELRRLLATSLGGGTGRNGGFIRKINPTAMEPSVGLSQRQTQTELEQAFFHNLPASLKRTVEFVAERTCSNCVKHIRATLLAGLVEEGEARVSALAGGVPADLTLQDVCTQLSGQGTAAALDAAQRFCATKAPQVMRLLLPEELSPQVVSTAADIVVRLAQEKAAQWLNSNVDKLLSKALRSRVDGPLKSASCSLTSEPSRDGSSVRACPAACSHANPMPSLVLTQLKEFLCVTVAPSCEDTAVTEGAVLELVRSLHGSLQCKKYLSPPVEKAFAQYAVELAAAIAFDRVLSESPAVNVDCWEESTRRLLGALQGVWTEFSMQPPFHLLLANKNVSYLHSATDKKRCCWALLHLSRQLVAGRLHVGSALVARWDALLEDLPPEGEIRECLLETANKFKELCEEESVAKSPRAVDAACNPVEPTQQQEEAALR